MVKLNLKNYLIEETNLSKRMIQVCKDKDLILSQLLAERIIQIQMDNRIININRMDDKELFKWIMHFCKREKE